MEFAICEAKATFGRLEYVGRKEEFAEYVNGRRQPVGYYHAIMSVKQQETIEVIIPNRVNTSGLSYGYEVILRDVRCVPFSQAAGTDGAVAGWTIKAQGIEKA